MIDGKIKGYFLLGQNPAVGSAHGRAQRLGMANLDWLVVRDLFMIESATFWQNAPEIETGEIVPEECRTEVFFLPAASHVEKEGTFTQTQRLLQWREKAVEPPGDARSELWFFYHLGRIIRERLAASTAPRDRALLDLTWDYPTHGPHAEPSAEAVLREINGYDVSTGR
ncbi:molybdopterin-dependent oxidoreductase, partial [Micromonospora sp. CPCC 205558]|uniref:molybdopterin-dependent oxidoreductase n=1 Tax=Micromonospora sp. CPCC 205558 TaxID=3122403 RepID=UPI002FF03EC1